MAPCPAPYRLLSSHPCYHALVEPLLERHGLEPAPEFRHGVALIVLDYPLGWAFGVLDGTDSFRRSHTLVVTQAQHPVYRDCLGSHHVSGVVDLRDESLLLSAVYAAANAQRLHRPPAGLTYMELRVTRLLLQGLDTRDIAAALRISHKTVNAHVSNVLCKLEYDSRAQYIAKLMGQPAPAAAALP